MLQTTIVGTNPDTGQSLDIPPKLMAGVQRASDILADELADVASKFDLGAQWRFATTPDLGWSVELDLAAGRSVHVLWAFPESAFSDDDSIRRNLRPPLSKLAQMLSGLVKVQLELIQKRIQRDLEALATVGGE
jgi:hypothetical protein